MQNAGMPTNRQSDIFDRNKHYFTSITQFARKYIFIQKYVKIILFVSLISFYIFAYNIQFTRTKATADNKELQKKYILLWTLQPTPREFKNLIRDNNLGSKIFIKRNCAFTNCFIKAGRKYRRNYKRFHAIAFVMSEIDNNIEKLPRVRYPHQKFVFTSSKSSHNYPACSDKFDGYFNLTWTYRLDSDIRFKYITVLDSDKNVIGPNKIMHWINVKNMQPVNDTLRKSLDTKTKAAAWFVSKCETKSKRELFVKELQTELAIYNDTIDIYGNCGRLRCPTHSKRCKDMIKKDYFFYLSFENSFSEDYVTEKLLHALKNNAVPIVYGKANYTRFMPDGIYLNAIELGPRKLAKKMSRLIRSRKRYANYFKWKKYYSYNSRSESAETDYYCAICKLLNDENKFNTKSVIKKFREWWNSPDYCLQ